MKNVNLIYKLITKAINHEPFKKLESKLKNIPVVPTERVSRKRTFMKSSHMSFEPKPSCQNCGKSREAIVRRTIRTSSPEDRFWRWFSGHNAYCRPWFLFPFLEPKTLTKAT